MRRFAIRFKPFRNAFTDDMKIEAETLLTAAEAFKKTFPKGKILDIQPEQYAVDNMAEVRYHNFPRQPMKSFPKGYKGSVIQVDFRFKKIL